MVKSVVICNFANKCSLPQCVHFVPHKEKTMCTGISCTATGGCAAALVKVKCVPVNKAIIK